MDRFGLCVAKVPNKLVLTVAVISKTGNSRWYATSTRAFWTTGSRRFAAPEQAMLSGSGGQMGPRAGNELGSL